MAELALGDFGHALRAVLAETAHLSPDHALGIAPATQSASLCGINDSFWTRDGGYTNRALLYVPE